MMNVKCNKNVRTAFSFWMQYIHCVMLNSRVMGN